MSASEPANRCSPNSRWRRNSCSSFLSSCTSFETLSAADADISMAVTAAEGERAACQTEGVPGLHIRFSSCASSSSSPPSRDLSDPRCSSHSPPTSC
ncbi:unnamed protein product [Boreogadus saida]